MLDMNKIMRVKNRSASMVIYRVMLDNGTTFRRELHPGEVVNVKYEELFKLANKPGGKTLIANFLQIDEVESVTTAALNELQVHAEPEYNMSEADIIELLRSGSLDAFLDCLDFAPTGVLELVKKFAVDLPLNDVAKREAIKNKTGFDVTAAINNKIAEAADEAETVEAPTATRRVQPASTPGRRTESKYKIVNTTPVEG